MKRPHVRIAKRPRMVSGATPRSPKDAAMHLVRLEFDAARLEMGISQAENRVATYREELKRNNDQRAALIDLLRD